MRSIRSCSTSNGPPVETSAIFLFNLTYYGYEAHWGNGFIMSGRNRHAPDDEAREYFPKMAAIKTCSMICSAGVALGMVISQAHAQTAGCVVMEVAGEDQAAFTNKSSPFVDKLRKENDPRGLGQQDATASLVRVPLPRPRERQRDTHDQDDAMDISNREKAFASGQNLTDYCSLKIESDTKR